MKIASEIAGFTLAKADLMRRAMGKKDKTLMADDEEGVRRRRRGARRSPKKLAGEIFDLIEKFASYGFNKSHSVAYSVIAYQTAYLKAHYPAEFMAATLSSEIGEHRQDRQADRRLPEARASRCCRPDVNESGEGFQRGGGRDPVRPLRDQERRGERDRDGHRGAAARTGTFENLFDFCRRVDLRLVNKKCLESLVQAGAFDSHGRPPGAVLREHRTGRGLRPGCAERGSSTDSRASSTPAARAAAPRMPIPALTAAAPWPESEKLAREKSVLGFYRVRPSAPRSTNRRSRSLPTCGFGDLDGIQERTAPCARAAS